MGSEYQLRRDVDKIYGLVYNLDNGQENIYTIDQVNTILNNYIDDSQLPSSVLNITYPINSVYLTTSSENDPSKLFGGVWSQLKTEDNIIYWKRTE